MKPKKPRPRKPRERPDLRRLAAPPPADFYRLPELELRGGNLLTDGCRRVLDFTPQRICLDMGGHPGNIVWRGPADRILRGQKIDCGGAVRAH